MQACAGLALQQIAFHELRLQQDQARRTQSERERQFEILVQGVRDYAVYMLDPAGIVSSWNAGAEAIKGYGQGEIVGQHFARFFTPAERQNGAPDRSLRIAAGEGRFETNGWRVRKNGTLFWANVVISSIRDDHGRLIGFAQFTRDITHRLHNEEQLRRLATTDVLTGMPNRYALLRQLGNATDDDTALLALVGLDGLKEVNDTLGQRAGDSLLQAAAERIAAALPPESQCGRFAGGTFAAIVTGQVPDQAHAQALAETLTAALTAPFVWGAAEISLDCNVGIVAARDCGSSVDDLLANADLALRDAKAKGPRTVAVFRDSLRQAVVDRRTLEAELEAALVNDEFALHFQPQVRLSDRRIAEAEALLRWNHPRRGWLGPDSFLGVLEQSSTAAAVNEFDLPANALELEITEKIAVRGDEPIGGLLQALSDMGVRLSFDDYGTGFASLSLLARSPVDRLKIDRSFVTDIGTDSTSQAIAKSILDLAIGLGLDAVAEGIERVEQEDKLRQLGCPYGQGFLYRPAVPAEEFLALLSAPLEPRRVERPVERPMAGLAERPLG